MNQPPTQLTVQLLTKEQQPLLRKFYRSHNSPMRITQQADTWIARRSEIIAGVCLSPVDQGYWLTSLFTAPSYRQQGTAHFLIQQLQLAYQNSPIWLFCHPDLSGFYSKLGFRQTQHLPEALGSRLKRYQQHKQLIAMSYKAQEFEPQRQQKNLCKEKHI
ncbi:MAG TPA: GNAT family N-acetyltransferase [Thiopseudomonas sp.]|nr:GNAT family N-acetyltransferase [Thiopseudomonas sp.]